MSTATGHPSPGHALESGDHTSAGALARTADIPGLVLVAPTVHRDARGFFREIWHADRYVDLGIAEPFVQDNASYSQRGVLRGLHFQEPGAQGKLVTAVLGHVYDVAVDVRVGSPTFGRWAGVHLTGDNGLQLYLPPGVAHGFIVLSDVALFSYKCTAYYAPAAERVLRWDDPDLGIVWPAGIAPTVSPRDAAGRPLRDFALHELPRWT